MANEAKLTLGGGGHQPSLEGGRGSDELSGRRYLDLIELDDSIGENEGDLRKKELARTALLSALLVNDLAEVERVPRLESGRRENDVDHSFMLATLAPNLAAELRPDLDQDKIRLFALVHDMLEIETGDVATFGISPKEQQEKERREREALERLLPKLPPIEAAALVEYEKQDTPEARWVRYVDKMLPLLVDIIGQGVRVVEEDFGVSSPDQLRKSHDELIQKNREMFGNEFPKLDQLYSDLCRLFEKKYEIESEKRRKTISPERPSQHVETERKYLIGEIDEIPYDLGECEKAEIKQGYLAINPDGSEVRIRSFGDGKRFELTTKTSGTVARGEQTIKITEETFDVLWPKTEGAQVEKTRYYLELTDEHGRPFTVEIDVYHGKLSGLITAEVEFGGREADALVRAATFTAPEWFGEDVSDKMQYKNHALASMQHGLLSLGQ